MALFISLFHGHHFFFFFNKRKAHRLRVPTLRMLQRKNCNVSVLEPFFCGFRGTNGSPHEWCGKRRAMRGDDMRHTHTRSKRSHRVAAVKGTTRRISFGQVRRNELVRCRSVRHVSINQSGRGNYAFKRNCAQKRRLTLDASIRVVKKDSNT